MSFAISPSPSSPWQLQRCWQVAANGIFRGTDVTCKKSIGIYGVAIVTERTWTSGRPVFARLANIELLSPLD